MLLPFLLNTWRISLTVRLRLSLEISTSTATPPGPYPSSENSSYVRPGSSPVPRWTARLMLSAGIFSALAAWMAVRSRVFLSGSPPDLAAIEVSLMRRVKILLRLASSAPFWCLIVAHFELPDIERTSLFVIYKCVGFALDVVNGLPRKRRRRTEIIACKWRILLRIRLARWVARCASVTKESQLCPAEWAKMNKNTGFGLGNTPVAPVLKKEASAPAVEEDQQTEP